MKYILDTNICIYIIKKKPIGVHEKFNQHPVGDICLSSVTLAELKFGAQKSQHPLKNNLAIEKFISPLEILFFDDRAADHYGILRAHLEKKGTPIGPLDYMIAAHAQSIGAILVTNNQKEFSRIPKLKTENWV